MLPTQQFSPRGQSTTDTSDLTTSMSQGSLSHASIPYGQRRERGSSGGGGHMRLKPTISAPAKAEGKSHIHGINIIIIVLISSYIKQ